MQLLLYCLFISGVLPVVLWKAAPCQWEGSDTQPNCKGDKRREIFLGTQQGLNGVDTTQDVTESCWTGRWAVIFSSMLKKLYSHFPICGSSRVSGVAVHLGRVLAFHLGIRYRKRVVCISNTQGHKSKCFPYRMSLQSSLKWKTVFHEHLSLEYSDCSKMQNCDYGKEEYTN